ncbi:MAG: hypothetical protein AB7V27_03910 [Candidatus Binatia bacterium]
MLRRRLALIFAAPALAWSAQLEFAYAFASAGCPWGSDVLLWFTAAAAAIAAGATWCASLLLRKLDRGGAVELAAGGDTDRFLIHTAIGVGAICTLTIVAQALPLGVHSCG